MWIILYYTPLNEWVVYWNHLVHPSVIISLQLSHWTDWFQICYAASHIWGICCKQFQLLSDINFLFCWILNFSVYVINDSKKFCHKNLGAHWLNRFQILYAVSYWWGIRCKQFWLLSDINFLLIGLGTSGGILSPTTLATPCYYPFGNKVAKGYCKATVCMSFRQSVISLWTL